jgi:predicted lipoprotein
MKTGGHPVRTVAAIVLAATVSCSDGGGDEDASVPIGRRPEVAASLGANVILPAYRRVAEVTGTLVEAVDAYAAAPSAETRATAQAAWGTTMDAFEEIEMMQLGPLAAMDLAAGGADLRDAMYAWPALSLCAVDQDTAGASYADPDALLAGTINQHGLGAIEYLLYVESTANNCSPLSPINADGTWAAFTPEVLEARRARHAHSLAVLVKRTADDLVMRWEPAGGGFLAELTDPTRTGALYGSAQEALNAISDAMFYLDKETKDMKIGEPAGIVVCAEETCPDSRESRFANRDEQHVLANLRAFQALYLGGPPGTEALGFDDLLRDLGATAFADEMATHIADAIVAVEAIEGTLVEALATDLARVRAAHTAIYLITMDLKTMFLSVLDLEIPDRAAGDND